MALMTTQSQPSFDLESGAQIPDPDAHQYRFLTIRSYESVLHIRGILACCERLRPGEETLTPSGAHNYIKSFLGDNHHFENASKVQGFVRIVASVNDRNKSWGNAVFRVGESGGGTHPQPLLEHTGGAAGRDGIV
ncbi:predicted protein [Postia placenta Mad-698-R]|nr:predicted protein [Postia placenta Mad-698-R]